MKNLATAAILILTASTLGCSGCEETYLSRTCPQGSQEKLPCVVTPDGTILVSEKITKDYTEFGVCHFGQTSCIEEYDDNGVLVDKVLACEGFVLPSEEICDGKDNDCDCPGDTNGDGIICGCSHAELIVSQDLGRYWVPGKGCDHGVDDGFDEDNDKHSICGRDGILGTWDDDCNDADPDIHPLAEEICDGKDNNCSCLNKRYASDRDTNNDGEECTCTTNETGSFSEVDSAGISEPVCRDGIATPLEDRCCDEGIDEDLPHASFACFEDIFGNVYNPTDYVDNSGSLQGICQIGKKQCVNGTYTPCDATTPQEEICDGMDNDCDGEADNGALIEIDGCYDGPPGTENIGICHPGNLVCVAPELYCWEQQLPEEEFCDGVDNDCDGTIDNNVDDTVCDLGCGPGINSCDIGGNGEWTCFATAPTQEICDNIDNDCDGLIDEEVADFNNDGLINDEDVCPCQLGDSSPCAEEPMFYWPTNPGDPLVQLNPACGTGLRQCIDENNDGITEWSVCFHTGTTAEICDGWDNDCTCGIDAVDIDADPNVEDCEILNVPCYSGPPGTQGVGECQEGYRECSGQGYNGPCIGEVLPSEEICDQLDNDCDGDIDEDLNPHEKVDMLFLIDGSGSMGTVGNMNTPINTLFLAISDYAATFQQTLCPPTGNPNGPDEQCHRWAVAVLPGTWNCGGNNPTYTLINSNNGQVFKTIGGLLNDIGAIQGVCGSEPSLDVAYASMSPQPPQGDVNLNMQLNWREDAYPYIVLMTDETSQTWHGITAQDVTARMSNCTVGCCVAHQDCEETPGGEYEFYVVTNNTFANSWGTLPNSGHVKDFAQFSPNLGGSVASGVAVLQEIFQDVCVPGP